MKVKNILLIASIFLIILCIGSVSASQNDSELSIDDGDVVCESENINEVSQDTSAQNNELKEDSTSSNTTTSNDAGTNSAVKTTAYATGITDYIQKSNKNFKVKIYTMNKNKAVFQKNVKIIVKLKIGKKTKTYHVKTNSKGIASVFNVKKLKVGSYKVTVLSDDDRYKIKDSCYFNIYGKKQKTITLKMNKRKKVKGDYLETFYTTKNGEFKKGVYALSYNAKNPNSGTPHSLILKAQFFYKNKKTGKVITKTAKTKDDSYYLYTIEPHAKLISGYTPIKTKIWYVTV